MERNADGVTWRKARTSGANGGQCVEIGTVIESPVVLIRNTKNRERGHLTVTRETFQRFMEDVARRLAPACKIPIQLRNVGPCVSLRTASHLLTERAASHTGSRDPLRAFTPPHDAGHALPETSGEVARRESRTGGYANGDEVMPGGATPLLTRNQAAAIRAAFPSYEVTVSWRQGARPRFEVVTRNDGNPWCLISPDADEIRHELEGSAHA
jgi:hypothetical protein